MPGIRDAEQLLRSFGGTGVAADWDELCSSVRVPVTRREDGTLYGTRSQTVLAVWDNGTAELQERNIDAATGTWGSINATQFSVSLQSCAAQH